MMAPVCLQAPTPRPRARFRTRRLAPAALALALTIALLILSACSGASSANTGTGTGNGGTSSATSTTSTTAPTATPLSSVPQITLAFCQGIMSVSDANTFMKPATAATTIVPDNARPGGSCSYTYGQGRLVLSIYLQPFPAGASLQAIAQEGLAQAKAKNDLPSGANGSITPVSGVGDQALYLDFHDTINGFSLYYGAFDFTLGSVAISCFNFGPGSPTTPQQPALTQACTQVASRL